MPLPETVIHEVLGGRLLVDFCSGAAGLGRLDSLRGIIVGGEKESGWDRRRRRRVERRKRDVVTQVTWCGALSWSRIFRQYCTAGTGMVPGPVFRPAH